MANTRIPNPSGWTSIFAKLGLSQFGAFFLSDTVVPVALVDSEITLSAASAPPTYGSPASGGELIAPAANTRLADTGQLPAGNYTFTLIFNANEANHYRLRRRNAADAADVWSVRMTTGASSLWGTLTFRTALLLNERFVLENVGVGTAGVVYQASIFAVASP